ncbi:MAG: hypothetical protein M0C28_37365 [Candidatus Moduliflexus flocculans]|nr:hypothetical protein [Candidatus Moduliflexus flocculans]
MSGGPRVGTLGRHFRWLAAAGVLAAGAAGHAGGVVTIEKTAFQGWPNCYRVSNGTVEFIATTDVGPRIISFGFVGGANLFFVREDFAGQTGGSRVEELRRPPRSGTRPRTRSAPTSPTTARSRRRSSPNGLLLTMPPGPLSGIQKAIEITLDPASSEVRVIHRLRNTGAWPVELAPWAISVMAPGGFAIAPLPTAFHPDRLLPNRALTLWPYTDMRDDRWLWGTDYILLRQKVVARPERADQGRDQQQPRLGGLLPEARSSSSSGSPRRRRALPGLQLVARGVHEQPDARTGDAGAARHPAARRDGDARGALGTAPQHRPRRSPRPTCGPSSSRWCA